MMTALDPQPQKPVACRLLQGCRGYARCRSEGCQAAASSPQPTATTPSSEPVHEVVAPLADDTAAFLAEQTEAIHALGRRVASDIIEIGNRLIAVKERLQHGEWLPWLRDGLGWRSEDTAQRFMAVARAFADQIPQDAVFQIDGTALYLLASPRVPEPAREEATKRARSGERITRSVAQQIVEGATPLQSATKFVAPESSEVPPVADGDRSASDSRAGKSGEGSGGRQRPVSQQPGRGLTSRRLSGQERNEAIGKIGAQLREKPAETIDAIAKLCKDSQRVRELSPPRRLSLLLALADALGFTRDDLRRALDTEAAAA